MSRSATAWGMLQLRRWLTVMRRKTWRRSSSWSRRWQWTVPTHVRPVPRQQATALAGSWLTPPTSDTICRDLWRTSWFDASTFDEEGRSAGCSWDVLIRWSLESWINHRSGKLTVTMYRRLLQQREHPQLFRPLRLMIVMMLMMMTCEGTSLRPIYKVYKLLSLSSDLELTNSFIYFHLKYVILHLCIWKLIWFIQINTFGVVGTGFSMAISRGLLHGSCNFDNDYRVSCGQKLSTIPQYIASLWLCYFKVSGSLEITSALFVV